MQLENSNIARFTICENKNWKEVSWAELMPDEKRVGPQRFEPTSLNATVQMPLEWRIEKLPVIPMNTNLLFTSNISSSNIEILHIVVPLPNNVLGEYKGLSRLVDG